MPVILNCRRCRKEKRQDPRYMEEIFKEKVRSFTRNCIKIGILIKGKCEVCDTNEKVEAHHGDYNKPLEIRWLCREHHREHHKITNKEED